MNQDEDFKQQVQANDVDEAMAELNACLARENFKKLFDETSALREKNVKLRLELHTLRFKESQEKRFIWWIWNVYSRNVDDLIHAIMGATTYDTEGDAKGGKYALPKQCFDLMKRISEYTEKIYDGTYLDVEISADVKNGIPENKPAYNENANSLLRSAWMIANRNGEKTNWEAFKNAVYKELVEEHNAKHNNLDYYNPAKTSTDNNKLKELSDRFYLLLVDNPNTKLLADQIMIDVYGNEFDRHFVGVQNTQNNKLDAHTLEWAARWIIDSLIGETDERLLEFGKNMAMSIRAAKPSKSDVSATQDVL